MSTKSSNRPSRPLDRIDPFVVTTADGVVVDRRRGAGADVDVHRARDGIARARECGVRRARAGMNASMRHVVHA